MLNETIQAGLNNPDCAFFVGSWTGSFLSFKYLIAVFVIYGVMKALGRLALEPLIAYVKTKFKKQK